MDRKVLQHHLSRLFLKSYAPHLVTVMAQMVKADIFEECSIIPAIELRDRFFLITPVRRSLLTTHCLNLVKDLLTKTSVKDFGQGQRPDKDFIMFAVASYILLMEKYLTFRYEGSIRLSLLGRWLRSRLESVRFNGAEAKLEFQFI